MCICVKNLRKNKKASTTRRWASDRHSLTHTHIFLYAHIDVRTYTRRERQREKRRKWDSVYMMRHKGICTTPVPRHLLGRAKKRARERPQHGSRARRSVLFASMVAPSYTYSHLSLSSFAIAVVSSSRRQKSSPHLLHLLTQHILSPPPPTSMSAAAVDAPVAMLRIFYYFALPFLGFFGSSLRGNDLSSSHSVCRKSLAACVSK